MKILNNKEFPWSDIRRIKMCLTDNSTKKPYYYKM